MKALIVEINGRTAASLCENSTVIKIPNKGYHIGQQIEVVPKRKPVRRISAAVACIAMFFGISTTGYAALSPYSYVTLDVNPSFEYTLNRFDQVIDVNSVNEDADSLLEEIDIPKFADIDKVLRLTIDELYNEGYLTGEEKELMLLSVCGGSDSKTQTLTSALEDVTTSYDVTSDILEVTESDREAAADLNTTAGKLALILDVAGKSDKVNETDVEKYVDKSVKEIIAVLDRKKKPSQTEKPGEVSETYSGNSNSSGSGQSQTSPGKAPAEITETPTKPSSPSVPEETDTPSETPGNPTGSDDIDDISGPGK